MKVLFYNVDNYEFDYFLKNSFNLIEPYFFKISLNTKTYIDNKYIDAQALSVFVDSDLDKEVLEKFKNLKFIFVRSTGYSNVDLKYCKSNNIKVFNIPDYGSDSVAEYIFALILNISRKILKANEELKRGYIDKENLIGLELKEKTLGVIGIGSIGKKVLEIASGFKMNTMSYDIKQENGYRFVPLDKLLRNSDFIVLSCPLNVSTKYLINYEAFSKMKKNAYLINASRGEIINTESLYDAIINKKIMGAAIDVVECEHTLCAKYKECEEKETIKSNCLKKYLLNTKLMQMENVIITPHIAYNTEEAKKRIVDITIENIKSSFDINSGTKNLVLI